MAKQLLLFHNAVSAYFSGNQEALEESMKDFASKVQMKNPSSSWIEQWYSYCSSSWVFLLVFVSVVLFHEFTRIKCFLHGCCVKSHCCINISGGKVGIGYNIYFSYCFRNIRVSITTNFITISNRILNCFSF